MSISKILTDSARKLKKITDRPDWEAELLLAEALKKPQAWILAHNDYRPTKKELAVFDRLVARRSKGEPLAYVLGEQDFYGLAFKVNKNVLIPRPETEKLVDLILESDPLLTSPFLRGRKFSPPPIFKKSPSPYEGEGWGGVYGVNDIIVDIGTGSGVIIVSLAKNIKNKSVKFLATDISAKALAVAKQNAKLNQVDKDIIFLKGNLLEPFLCHCEKRSDVAISILSPCTEIATLPVVARDDRLVIVANLPYLKIGLPGLTKEQKHALSFEPTTALMAGADGLKYYRQLAAQIKKLRATYPRLKLTLYLEADPDQMSQLKKLFPACKATIIKNFCGYNRFLILNSI